MLSCSLLHVGFMILANIESSRSSSSELHSVSSFLHLLAEVSIRTASIFSVLSNFCSELFHGRLTGSRASLPSPLPTISLAVCARQKTDMPGWANDFVLGYTSKFSWRDFWSTLFESKVQCYFNHLGEESSFL